MKQQVVIGLGSILMGDEGIGIYLAQDLQKKAELFPGTEILDLGASGFKVIHRIANRKRVLFIDCAFMGLPPGSIRRFTPEEVISVKSSPSTTNHAADLLSILEISKNLGECPEEVIFFGVQPESVEQKQCLSDLLQQKRQEYLFIIEEEIKKGYA